MSTRFPLAAPSWGPEDLAAIQSVVDSGQFSMAHRVQQFELEFARYVGARHAVMVNSGSSANLLMTAALALPLDHLRRGEFQVVLGVAERLLRLEDPLGGEPAVGVHLPVLGSLPGVEVLAVEQHDGVGGRRCTG